MAINDFTKKIEDGVLNMVDDFDSLSEKYIQPESGHYFAKLSHAEFIPETQVGTYYMGQFEPAWNDDGTPKTIDRHYELHFLAKDGTAIKKNLYPSGVEFFIRSMCRQTEGKTAAMKCSEIFNYIGKHYIELWVTYNKDNGQQVDFFDREKFNKEKRKDGAASGKATRNASRPTESKALRN